MDVGMTARHKRKMKYGVVWPLTWEFNKTSRGGVGGKEGQGSVDGALSRVSQSWSGSRMLVKSQAEQKFQSWLMLSSNTSWGQSRQSWEPTNFGLIFLTFSPNSFPWGGGHTFSWAPFSFCPTPCLSSHLPVSVLECVLSLCARAWDSSTLTCLCRTSGFCTCSSFLVAFLLIKILLRQGPPILSPSSEGPVEPQGEGRGYSGWIIFIWSEKKHSSWGGRLPYCFYGDLWTCCLIDMFMDHKTGVQCPRLSINSCLSRSNHPGARSPHLPVKIVLKSSRKRLCELNEISELKRTLQAHETQVVSFSWPLHFKSLAISIFSSNTQHNLLSVISHYFPLSAFVNRGEK